MAERGKIEVNRFTKGLITEANPLTYPAEASLDEINFKLKKNGSRERRLGLDYEDSYALYDTGLSASVLAEARVRAYRWSMPNGHFDVEIGVIQVGNTLYFVDLLTDNPSANLLNGGAGISAIGTNNDQLMTFATINNYLIGISNAIDNPYLFSYDKDTDTVSYETAPILVRDLWGVDDGLEVNERPTALSNTHKYNLLNQGWDENIVTTCGAGINAIDCTFNTFGVYPSNSDQWTIGRVEDLTDANAFKYDPTQAERNIVNTGQVARGHFIIPAYARGASRSSQTGLALPTDHETGRFTAIASYAGRVFYAGIVSNVLDGDDNSPIYSSMIFFSQVFANKENLVRCHQDADPTNPDINDIIDTDGGVIVIPECAYIWQLKPIKQSLFVFGVNGVWEIRGDEAGFRATSYQVNKVSNVGVYARNSIEEVNGAIYFWGTGGIYQIVPNQFGTFDTNNITLETIQRLYNSIPDSSKRNSRVYYDQHTNTLRWLYYSSETKQIGSPIDYLPPAAVIPSSITTPVTVSFSGITMNYADCAVLDNSRYVIVGTRTTAGSKYIYGVVATIDIDNNVTFGASTLIDNTTNDYVEVSVCALTSSRILITTINDSTNTAYGISCSISGTNITKLVRQAVATGADTNAKHTKCIKIDSTHALVQFQGIVSGIDIFVATVSDSAIAFSSRVPITTFSLDRGDLESGASPSEFYSFCETTGPLLKVTPITVSGTTASVGTAWPSTGMDTDTTVLGIAYVSNGKYALRAIKASSGSTVKVVDSTGNLATINSTNTSSHQYADIFSANGNTIYLLYYDAPNSKIEAEKFLYDGSSTLTSLGVTTLQSGFSFRHINIANDGFTSTKVPVVYIKANGDEVMTLIIEAGT